MKIEKISLAHKDMISVRMQNIQTKISDYSFANLYLFRNFHDYHVLYEDQDVFIAGKTAAGETFIIPTENITPEMVGRMIGLAQKYDFIYPIPEEVLQFFSKDQWRFEFLESDSDYIYSVSRMATYSGQKLHGQKNLVNQFLVKYQSQAKPLTNDLKPDALKILEAWQKETAGSDRDTDYAACREALEYCEELVICGGIYYAQDEPAGFILGQERGSDTFVLLFAKAQKKFKGIYPYMFSHFSQLLPVQYEFLNLEQDMGRPALKLAKTSYHPQERLKKYRVRFVKK